MLEVTSRSTAAATVWDTPKKSVRSVGTRRSTSGLALRTLTVGASVLPGLACSLVQAGPRRESKSRA